MLAAALAAVFVVPCHCDVLLLQQMALRWKSDTCYNKVTKSGDKKRASARGGVLAQLETHAPTSMQESLSFQRWLKRLRAALDLTQERLAEEVGCAAHTIRTFERGTRRPSRAMAERLADVLQVPLEQWADFVRLARAPVDHAPAGSTTMGRGGAPGDGAGAPAADALSSGSPTSGQAATAGAGVVQPVPILATKLYVPQPRADVVPRPRLRARLDRGIAGPLTVIAAPAGFGKTTLLAEWLATVSHKPDAPIRAEQAAWLSLDAGDNDPVQFLRYLVAALQTVAPEIGRATLVVLQAAQAPPIDLLLLLLANDLSALPNPCILVLDDYHVIDAPAVHQALTFLLDHLPPQLHLVIATRVDPPLPVARLRVRRQLAELRAHDLRFTPEEAALFLREVMELPLSVEDVWALEERTEGWIAGLQLAALSLHDRPPEQMARFINAFAGSHRFVVDYLVDEVLARQPAHLQTFLLQTSILERLSGALCDAVVFGNQPDSPTQHHAEGAQLHPQYLYSQLILEELERSNLFIVPLDEERRWYRYHHLFAQLLRARLATGASQDAVASLHRRASVWFEQHGLLSEAVQHVLAARDWGQAARLLEQHAEPMVMRGEFRMLHRWLQELPPDVVRKQPHLLLAHAWAYFLAEPRQTDAIETILHDAEVVLGRSVGQPAGQGAKPPALDREAAELRGKVAAIRACIAAIRKIYPARLPSRTRR